MSRLYGRLKLRNKIKEHLKGKITEEQAELTGGRLCINKPYL